MISFDTKANTLARLQPLLKTADLLPQVCFTVQQWRQYTQADTLKNDLSLQTFLARSMLPQPSQSSWLTKPLIVRSSNQQEDQIEASHAGRYASVANVAPRDVGAAINQVIHSYEQCSDEDQVLIQPMIKDVAISGVAFTQDLSHGGHYYTINYDETSGRTDTITSGTCDNPKTLVIAKRASSNVSLPPNMPEWVKKLIHMLVELQALFNDQALDVEFVLSKENALYLLQVRKLTAKTVDQTPQCTALSLDEHEDCLNRICERIRDLKKPHPYLLGETSVFGLMPDWNPAEIIGVRPRPLALSLYKALITDSVWAYQRDNYGYRNLRSFPLLVNFNGIPYIDVRVSFNSFIPKDLDDRLATKLVDYYIQQLIQNPNYHDKVEFEIIQSCYSLDIDSRINALKDASFTDQECQDILKSLRNITNNIVNPKTGLWKNDIKKLENLKVRQSAIMASDLTHLEKIYWIIEDCKRYGTLPFAGLARAGFIATQMLQAFLNIGVFTNEDYQCFLSALNTVSSELVDDYALLSKDDFINKYGHLRPGTYDILSPRYDETPDQYFKWPNNQVVTHSKRNEFKLSLEKLNTLSELLTQHHLELDILSLFDFIKGAIEGREYAKFVFTKSLSDCVQLIGQLAQQQGISIDDASYLNIKTIESLYASSDSIKNTMGDSITSGKKQYRFTRALMLPSLIVETADVYAYQIDARQPNFITLEQVTAEVIRDDPKNQDISGKIIMLPNADPGYDWIFSHNIAGFITMYGGANSHMAIRAAELCMPAVTGCGEHYYKLWREAQVLELNCAAKQVRIIS